MIVVGVDPHKQTHTAVAVSSLVGELVDELTVKARQPGHEQLLGWARSLDGQRLFALEDCRHVSGALERFLIEHGERVVRVPVKLMAGARKGSRSFGKSDPIDALAVARAALREPQLPEAQLAGPALEIKLLLAHREDLVAESTRIHNRLRWHLHDLDPEIEIPARALSREVWLDRLKGRLRRHGSELRARLCRELVGRAKQNRQLNLALHRIAITQARLHPPARDYLARRRAQGKTWREALRCLKRHLVRTVFKLLKQISVSPRREQPLSTPPTPVSAIALT